MRAGLYNVPADDKSINSWSFKNADDHTLIIRNLSNRGVFLQTYPIDPISLTDLGNWLRRHQQMHTDMNSATGVAGNDLSDVDWQNPEQLQAWIWLHAQEHFLVSNKLGVLNG